MSHNRRTNCPICGGRGTVSITRGHTVERVAWCFKCYAPFTELAAAFGWPLEKKTTRRRRPPPRGTLIDQAIQDLADVLEARRRALLAKLPSADFLEQSGSVRHEMNLAKLLRALVTTLGPDSMMAWDFAREAAQRETRARLLILELDRQLSERHAPVTSEEVTT